MYQQGIYFIPVYLLRFGTRLVVIIASISLFSLLFGFFFILFYGISPSFTMYFLPFDYVPHRHVFYLATITHIGTILVHPVEGLIPLGFLWLLCPTNSLTYDTDFAEVLWLTQFGFQEFRRKEQDHIL